MKTETPKITDLTDEEIAKKEIRALRRKIKEAAWELESYASDNEDYMEEQLMGVVKTLLKLSKPTRQRRAQEPRGDLGAPKGTVNAGNGGAE